MAISFYQPLWLLLLPLLLYPLFLWYRDSLRFPRWRKNMITALRLCLLLALVLALAGMEFRFPLRQQSVVFVVDGSASCEKLKAQAEEFINQALEQKKPDDRTALILFGAEARVDQPLTARTTFSPIESLVDRNYTNPGEGLKLADALMPGETLRRVVLMTDGGQNDGDLIKEAAFLAQKGVRVDVLPLVAEAEPEARVKKLLLPEQLYPGERFNVKVSIESNVATPVLLRIYQDREVIGELESQVSRGENSFSCAAIIHEGGFHTFEATAEFQEDTVAENNTAHAFTMVQGPPLILLVEGTPGEAASISAALDSLDLAHRRIAPYQFPGDIDELQRYSAVILANVPAQALSSEEMEAINLGVKNMGMGLIMVGGDQSFGPGGYFKTPVETALPVHMDLRGKKEIPSLGLMLVIDKSGSMTGEAGGYAKIDLAREAALQASEVLSPIDQVGVLAFDDSPQWVVKMRPVDDLAAIQDDIATLRADGGTDIYPSLSLAYDALKKAETKYKHIILLTDGQSATSGDYYYLCRRMEREGITMSTVAVGDGSDTALLELLAQWGQGRYYFTNEAYSIPRIFTKETITALRSYLVEEPFVPARATGSEILESVSAVPELNGYVATTLKDSARLMLESHRGDPVLAGWQYGLGRSLAFTSDTGVRWASQWAGWEGYNRFWGNMLSWVLPRSQDGTLQMEAYIEGGKGYIKVRSENLTETSLISQASITTPALESRNVDLQPVAPGIFSGTFNAREPGVYLINAVQKKENQIVNSVSGGAALSYSPEYADISPLPEFLQKVAEQGGGSIISRPEEAFADNLPPVKGSVELWPWLLAIAACLLPLDIAARRLNLNRAELTEVVLSRRGKSDEELRETLPTTYSRLQQRKQTVEKQRQTLVANREEEEPAPPPSTEAGSPAADSGQGSRKQDNVSGLDTSRLLERKRQQRR